LGTIDLSVQKADKDASARLLWRSTPGKWATSWSEDGKYLAFDQVTPGAASDIWIYSSDSRDAKAFRNQPEISESNGQFSPNGNWIAFQANSDGPVIEIYVAPYPGPGRVCRISRSGGTHPRWSKDGRELVYQHLSEAWYVDLSSGNPCAARPVLMEGVQLQQEWAISPKGDFFVTFLPHDPPQLHVILNWLGDLRRQVDATSSSARR